MNAKVSQQNIVRASHSALSWVNAGAFGCFYSPVYSGRLSYRSLPYFYNISLDLGPSITVCVCFKILLDMTPRVQSAAVIVLYLINVCLVVLPTAVPGLAVLGSVVDTWRTSSGADRSCRSGVQCLPDWLFGPLGLFCCRLVWCCGSVLCSGCGSPPLLSSGVDIFYHVDVHAAVMNYSCLRHHQCLSVIDILSSRALPTPVSLRASSNCTAHPPVSEMHPSLIVLELSLQYY